MSETAKTTEKEERWVRPRHRFFRALAFLPALLLTKIKCGATVDRFKGDNKRQYLILYNHQTDYDQLLLGLAFRFPIYYLAMEDILSNGWISDLLRFITAPIPIKKQTVDLKAIRQCIRVAKEGGSLSIAPEGHRTYSGRTCYINPSIAKLARMINLPIILYRIEGGYGMQPRWSNVVRKGRVHCYVGRVIEPEEIKAMSNEELYQAICDGLYEDEAKVDTPYVHKQAAEFLDRVAYVCPYCGLSRFDSHDDIIRCTSCGREMRYLPTKELQGVGFKFPFRFVANWVDYQNDFINRLNPENYINEPVFRDEISLLQVILYKRKEVLREKASIALYGDRIVIDEGKANELLLSFTDSPVTLLGKNRLNIYHDNMVYQIKGDFHFNALKYLNFYNRWKNVTSGNPEATYLGM